ncbi:MAG: ATP-binding protein [Candidatus Kapabacteria bacterium]|jgi:signal transduction histidine kinase/ligand-binding sensor domain-containing protein|nr:ATP-binding protein [Candidatus Kapabacteria bacterium]
MQRTFVILLQWCMVSVMSISLPKMLSAQHKITYSGRFLSTSYSVDDGLPTNLIKDVQQDKQGFVWFASDAGLVRFDGVRFQTFVQNLPSNYVKSLLLRNNGQLLATTDLGVVEVLSTPDSVRFRVIIGGESEESKGKLHYPKESFEDTKGNLWFAEQQAVVRYAKGALKRFSFPEKCHSRNSVVSFYFANDNAGNLVVTANPGFAYRFNEALERFDEIHIEQNYGGFTQVQSFSRNEFVIAAEKGIVRIVLQEQGKRQNVERQNVEKGNGQVLERKKNQSNVGDTLLLPLRVGFTPLLSGINRISALLLTRGIYAHSSGITSSEVIVGTWYEGVFCADTTMRVFTPLPSIEPQRVKNISEDNEGNIWICGDQGVIILQPALARAVTGIEDRVPDVKALIQARDGSIIAATGQSVYRVHPEFTTTQMLFEKLNNSSELFALYADKQGGIWAGSLSGHLQYWRNGSVERTLTIAISGSSERGIFSITEDTEGNIWGCFYNPKASVFCLKPNGAIQYYGAESGLPRIVQVLRVAADGTLYAGAIGTPEEYLFRYNAAEDRFENWSKPFDNASFSAITVNDLTADPENPRVIYLASGHGLFRVDNEHSTKVVLSEEFKGNVCKAVVIEKPDVLWVGTDLGLLRHASGTTTLFHQASGLHSRTIAYRGLMMDAAGRLWAATTNGLYMLDTKRFISESEAPRFVEALVNGVKLSFDALPESFDSQSLIQLLFAPGTATPRNTQYQSRIYKTDTPKPAWSRAFAQPALSFTNLDPGTYIVEIIARSEGIGRTWSKPLALRFVVKPPFYSTWWAYLLYAIAGTVLVAFAVLVLMTARERSRIDDEARARIKLQRLVDERTAEISRQKELLETQTMEIQAANEELRQVNVELQKYNAQMQEAGIFKTRLLSMVSHDLKNPLGSLLGLSKLMENSVPEEEYKEMAREMKSLTEQTLALVKDLLDSAAAESGKIELHKNYVDIADIITAVAWQYKPQAEKKSQELITSLEANCITMADERRLWQVFENLVSNAVKYSPPEKRIWVTLERCPGQENAECARFSVRDEGPGLSKDDIAKAFGHFQRLSAQPTGGELSSGVGLSIVRQIVELHGGKVWIESELGKGATFIVELPTVEL